MRGVTAGTGLLTHFCHVDADAYARQVPLCGVRFLQAEGKRHSGARRLEGQEGTVSRPVNDAPVRLRCELSNLLSMPTYQLFHCLIAALPLQRSGVCEVGENKRENSGDFGRVSHRESHSWRAFRNGLTGP
jgi:hypothetical protein